MVLFTAPKNCAAVVKEKAFLPLGEIVEVVAKL